VKVFISGVRGFLGGELARHLGARGHQVTGTTTRRVGQAGSPLAGAYSWRFGDAVDPRWMEGVDVVIHAAHDFSAEMAVNVDGTRALSKAAREAGVRTQALISSLSARIDARSRYGQTKYAIEQQLAGPDVLVIRPGTVIGNGGLFGRMIEMVRKLPVVPLVGGGTTRMHLIGVGDVCLAVEAVLQCPPPADFNLYYRETPTLREVLASVSRLIGRRPMFVPVPSGLVRAALSVAGAVGLRLPVDRDNLTGFMQSQNQVHESDLLHVLKEPRSVAEALQQIVADSGAPRGGGRDAGDAPAPL